VGQAPKFNCPLHLDQPAQKEQAKPLAVLDLAGHRFHDLTQELVHLLALPGEPALNTLPTGKSLCRPLSGRGFNYLALLSVTCRVPWTTHKPHRACLWKRHKQKKSENSPRSYNSEIWNRCFIYSRPGFKI